MSTVLGGFSSLGCLLDPGLLCMMLQGRCSYSSGIIHDVIISAILHWTGQLKEVSHGYLDRLWAVPPLSVKSIVQFEQGTMDWVQEFKFCVALIVQKYCWLWAGNLSTRSHACQCLSAFQIRADWGTWSSYHWKKGSHNFANWLWKEPHLLGVLFHKNLVNWFLFTNFFHIHRKGGNTCSLGYLTQDEQQTWNYNKNDITASTWVFGIQRKYFDIA